MIKTTLIRKILIANRGEIACRIIRTCRAMGIVSVAVFSDADKHALHVEMADEAVYLGGSAATESYLNIEKVIEAAQRTHADAIHPGYGFLAENATFASAVQDAGIIFIGPTPKAIAAMGKKREAKRMLKNVPLVPGYSGTAQDDQTFITEADNIGYPVMVKASAGGGGKGMRRVDNSVALPEALAAARREAKQAFGDDTLILEKYIENPRHIEIQIFGDQHGNVVAFGERECSIQRRHQKIIEETPSPALTAALRSRMDFVAVDIGKQLDYQSAGTVEFLLDGNNHFYFMEVNTRLQVEHPVTELVYGLDLVKLQIKVAEGHSLLAKHLAYETKGHALEVRVYAEDPDNDFLPTTGEILHWHIADTAEHIRIDNGVRTGDEVTIHYDPMLAKITAWGLDRVEVIRKLEYTLSRSVMLGVRNNIGFLRRVLNHPEFIAGNLSTHFIQQHQLNSHIVTIPPEALIAAAIAKTDTPNFWRNNLYRPIRQTFDAGTVLLTPQKADQYIITIDEQPYEVSYNSGENTIILTINGYSRKALIANSGDEWWVHINGETYVLHWQTPLPVPGRTTAAEGSLRAPMPGQIVNVLVEVGQQVSKDTILMTMEAMKMEHRIQAPYDGTVGKIYYAPGEPVQAESILLELTRTSTEI